MMEEPASNHMRNCPYCGGEISEESFYCWYCKRKLETSPQPSSIPTAGGLLGRWLWVTLTAVAAFISILVFVLPLF